LGKEWIDWGVKNEKRVMTEKSPGRMRRGILLCASVFLAAAGAGAGSNTTYSFLRADVGARAAALAGSFVAITNDPTALFYNPAALATMDAHRGSAGFFKHLLDINSGHLVYTREFEDLGHFGAGVLYTNYGSFTETDESGNERGTFSAGDLALTVGYGNAIQENLYWGGNLKFVYSSIAGYSSTAIAADAGILFVIPESRAALGLSVRNAGTQLSSYLSTSELLPLDLTLGGSIVPKGLPLLLNLAFHRLNDDTGEFFDRFRSFTVGGEFTISRVIQLRIGFDNAVRKDLKVGTSAGLAGFAAGLGVTTGEYKIDYAVSLLGSIGNLHRISLATTL
jgi:hypothetical protein